MYVAIAADSDTAVAGPDIYTDGLQSTGVSTSDEKYQCLLCGVELTYRGDTAEGPFEYFQHPDKDCVNDGNVSVSHRLGQEVVAKRLYNWLPTTGRTTRIDMERRVGTSSEFVIADVLVVEPVRVAVEIVYHNTDLRVRRRLATLFENGYTVMVVGVTTGPVSPTRIEEHLNRITRIQVGRFHPDTRELELGSIMKPTDVDFVPDASA